MFDMKGFHVSASGAIQGHHGPLVFGTRRLHLYYTHAYRNSSGVHWNQLVYPSACVAVRVSISVQNTSNFVSLNPPTVFL